MKQLREILFNTLVIDGILLICLLPIVLLFNVFPNTLEAYTNFFGNEATTSYIVITVRVLCATPIVFIVFYIFSKLDNKEVKE